MPKTANETFRDFFLRRQHFIQRYENGVLRDMALSFRQAYPELQARMLNLQNVIPAPGTGFTQQFRIQRMRAQLADMQGIMNTAAINSSNHLTQALADFAHLENQSIAAMYAQQFGKVNISFTQLPFRQIDSILTEPLIWQRRGIGIADVMLENVDKAMAQIRGELTQSIILGDDMAQAAKRLTGTVGRFTGLTAKQLARRTEVIARSEIQNVAAQVSRQITQENNDVLKSVVFTSTLDSRTCLLPDTEIKTCKGNKKISDIDVNDYVKTHKDRYRKVDGKMISEKEKYYKLTLSNGKTLKVTGQHQVLKAGIWVMVQDLKIWDEIYGL